MSIVIDLGEYLEPGRMAFSGDQRGRQVRRDIGLDLLDQANERVRIIAPERIRAITASFLQALIEDSVIRLGVEGFRKRYEMQGPALEKTLERVLEYAGKRQSAV